MIGSVEISSQLPRVKSVLALRAHPDDESFGLGGALSAFSDSGSATSVVCFTRAWRGVDARARRGPSPGPCAGR